MAGQERGLILVMYCRRAEKTEETFSLGLDPGTPACMSIRKSAGGVKQRRERGGGSNLQTNGVKMKKKNSTTREGRLSKSKRMGKGGGFSALPSRWANCGHYKKKKA